MKRFALIFAASVAATLSGCKPPPGDAALVREMPEEEPVFASAPLASPDVEGAIWAPSQTAGRIIYGVPEQPALIALACTDLEGAPLIEITRIAPADEGAEALLALVGNGAIGRIEVNAAEIGQNRHWRGAVLSGDRNIEPLTGPRKVTATIPGAGMVELNPSALPARFIAECAAPVSAAEPTPEPEPAQPADPE